ncbi:hypothetical protein FRC02_006695, partial [Tulasnella sp. 418]
MYRSPTNMLPWLVTAWLTKTPLIFLVCSVLLFSVGLVTWTFASQQKLAVSICTTVIAFVALLALPATLLLWTAFEYWKYTRSRNVSRNSAKRGRQETGQGHLFNWASQKLEAIKPTISRVCSSIFDSLKRRIHGEVIQDPDIEQNGGGSLDEKIIVGPSPSPVDSIEKRKPVSGLTIFTEGPFTEDPRSESEEAQVVDVAKQNLGFLAELPTSPRSVRFDMNETNFGHSPSETTAAARSAEPPTTASITAGTQMEFLLINQRRSYFGRHNTPREEQLRSYVMEAIAPTLRELVCSQKLGDNHKASITNLRFSRNGTYFASGSIDHNAIVWKVDELKQMENYGFYFKLKHNGEGASVQQVAWSPTDDYLLTRSRNHIKLWTAETKSTVNITDYDAVQAVAWQPDGQAFIALENNRIHVLDHAGNETNILTVKKANMEIQNLTFTHDGQHLLFIAAVLKPIDEKLKWSKCKAEKRLV